MSNHSVPAQKAILAVLSVSSMVLTNTLASEGPTCAIPPIDRPLVGRHRFGP
jgi:hypothetical protein